VRIEWGRHAVYAQDYSTTNKATGKPSTILRGYTQGEDTGRRNALRALDGPISIRLSTGRA